MVYLEKKTIGGKKYYYLAENIRSGKKWKKVRVYLGKGPLSKKELEDLKKEKSKEIEKRVQEYLRTKDPLLKILSEKEIGEIGRIKKSYDSKLLRMDKVSRKKYFDWFLTHFTYNTNAIEGSTIKLEDAEMVLLEGIVPSNKTVREIREVENHKDAFDFIMSYKADVSKNFVLKLHNILFHNILGENAGRFRKVQVFVMGAEEIPPRPENVEIEVSKLMKWYKFNKKRYDPVVVASYMHCGFEGIHPFIDGNGRVGRLLLNFILMKNGLPPIDIKEKRRLEYYEAVRSGVRGDLRVFIKLVLKYLKDNVLIKN